MSVFLIIESLDLKAGPLPSDLAAFVQSSWDRGDSKRRGGVYDTSGHTFTLSEADLDAIDEQIENVTAFFSQYAESCSRYISALASPKGELVLAACISAPAVAQEITLPVELVAAAGMLGVSVSLRTYLTDESAS